LCWLKIPIVLDLSCVASTDGVGREPFVATSYLRESLLVRKGSSVIRQKDLKGEQYQHDEGADEDA
jgi:hypothetical protein